MCPFLHSVRRTPAFMWLAFSATCLLCPALSNHIDSIWRTHPPCKRKYTTPCPATTRPKTPCQVSTSAVEIFGIRRRVFHCAASTWRKRGSQSAIASYTYILLIHILPHIISAFTSLGYRCVVVFHWHAVSVVAHSRGCLESCH